MDVGGTNKGKRRDIGHLLTKIISIEYIDMSDALNEGENAAVGFLGKFE